MESFFFSIIIDYIGYALVYVYYNYIKRQKVTWRQIEEEKDNYGMSKYGVLAGFLGFIFVMALILISVKVTTGRW